MKPPPHLSLERLIPIAAQLNAALHLGSDDLAPHDHGLRETLKSHAHRLKGHSGDLGAAFTSYHRIIESSLDGQSPSTAFSQAISALRQGLVRYSCLNCRKGSPPCSRQEPTNERVHLGGKCIEPIIQLFKDVAASVAGLWHRTAEGSPVPGLRLATGYLDMADKSVVQGDYSLTGNARIYKDVEISADGRPAPMTTITISFYDASFGWPEYSLLPYLMFHEIVCHGYQDVYDGGVSKRSRQSAPADCVWSEGWMDTVAYHLATNWLHERGATHRIVGSRTVRKASHTMADYHDARYSWKDEILSPERHAGRQAFDRIRESLIGPDFPDHSAFDLLARFSLLLNACVIPGLTSPDTPNLRRRRIGEALDLLAVDGEAGRCRAMMEAFLKSRNLETLPQ